MNEAPDMKMDWQAALSKYTLQDVAIERVSIVGGGSINEARVIHTNLGSYFAKINDAEKFPGMFEAECQGLQFLSEHSEFAIPTPIHAGRTGSSQWLIMEHLSGAQRKPEYWAQFGQRLAGMHKRSNTFFGLERSNYLGSLVQYNEPCDTWPEFYRTQRLLPQMQLAREQGKLSTQMERGFERLFAKLDDFFPPEPPAALHGDLWSGNFMTNKQGEASIFDPAVYYGHREMDLAMTHLFGGFDEQLYAAYHEEYPLEPGWEERVHVANLYPLMAHVNLFAGSYVTEVNAVLRKHT